VAAAAAAAIGAVADHALTDRGQAGGQAGPESNSPSVLRPNQGAWRQVAIASELPDGATKPFDTGSVNGFVHRADGKLIAVSGVCTHQGCRLWLDAAADRLRCPCHVTSFAATGEVLAHQLPISPAPLPRLAVRQTGAAIEIFTPK
jgi:nitrite reductase/ring-hydroxylating ferredoxin subunit